nr:MAG TPA: hypothetical protein [Crassvirales sp.]
MNISVSKHLNALVKHNYNDYLFSLDTLSTWLFTLLFL